MDVEMEIKVFAMQWDLLVPQNNKNPITFMDFLTLGEDSYDAW